MRKIYLLLSIVFTILSIVFTILPMDTLAFLPIGLAIVFCLVTLAKSIENQKKIPQVFLIISVMCSVIVLGKTIFIKDEIEKDQQFEQQKIETKSEAKKELEALENELE